MTAMQKRELISPGYPDLSVSAQCKLIGLQRSSYYFKPKGESLLNQQLMKAIDRKFLECPFYGVERMTDHLRGLGYSVNSKRVRRLYKVMNLRTLHPKRNLSKAKANHHKYPYLLKGLKIARPNQVWQADITYIPMFRGFMYMFAIIDVYSRRIVGWSTSNTMSMEWCREVLLDTIRTEGKPEIVNTDQGSQFTSPDFVKCLLDNEIKVSMDGKGRALDNVYIERFWRSLKHEYIYLNPPNGGVDLYKGVKAYVKFYNGERKHTGTGFFPDDLFFGKDAKVS